MEEEKETFSDRLCSSNFSQNLLKAYRPVLLKRLKLVKEGHRDYISLLTEKENKVRLISEQFANLRTVVGDIEKVFIFLRYQGSLPLKGLYPLLEEEKMYYAYHLENYLIRVCMLPDVLVAIGNCVNSWGLPLLSYGTTLLNPKKNKKVEQGAIDLIKKLIDRIKDVKDLRNQKLHIGKVDVSCLIDIVWWGDINIPGLERNELLEEFAEDEKNRQLEDLEQEVFEVIDIVNDFLDLMAEKVNDLLEQ